MQGTTSKRKPGSTGANHSSSLVRCRSRFIQSRVTHVQNGKSNSLWRYGPPGIRAHTRTRTHTHAHARTHTHTHTCTNTHARALARSPYRFFFVRARALSLCFSICPLSRLLPLCVFSLLLYLSFCYFFFKKRKTLSLSVCGHIWLSHDTYDCVMAYMIVWQLRHICIRVVTQSYMCHDSVWHGRGMSHVLCVTRQRNESRHIRIRQIEMGLRLLNENKSFHIRIIQFVTCLIHMCDASFACVTWLMQCVSFKCDMAESREAEVGLLQLEHTRGADFFFLHSYVKGDIRMCHISCICVTWLIQHVWHASFICVMPRSRVWHDSFIYVSCLMHQSVVSHSSVCHVWRDSSIWSQKWAHCEMNTRGGVVVFHSCVCHVWRDSSIWGVTSHMGSLQKWAHCDLNKHGAQILQSNMDQAGAFWYSYQQR